MSNQKVDFVTPAGRLVMGHPFEGQTKDAEGRDLVTKTGPNTGQKRTNYFVAVAIPKTDPGWPALWELIQSTARRDFPTLFDATGACINPAFAFKVVDGDSQVPNSKGRKPCDREGYPGNYILHMQSGFVPKCFARTGGALVELIDPNEIKRGYYIRVAGSIVGNDSMQQPGVYLNLFMIERIGFGDEIVVGPQADEVFADAPAALPTGCSATPLASSAPPVAGMAGPGVPPVVAPPMAAPPAGVAPAPDFLTPPPVAAPAPPPAAVVQYRTPDGGTWTTDQLVEAGYTAEQIQALPRT